jgi:hypothetical protein
MEAVAHDPGVGQRGPDRLAVGLSGVYRDDLDAGPHLVGQRGQPPLDDLALTAGQHLDDASAVKVRDDRGQLATAAMVRLIKRQPARRAILPPRDELVAGDRERPGDLVAAGALIARDLGVRAASPTALEQMRAKPGADPLTRRQRRVRLGEGPLASLADKPALAPPQERDPTRDGQIAHP